VDCDQFRSRRLRGEWLSEADLVLASTTAERDRVLAEIPTAGTAMCTVKEFARLVAAVPGQSLVGSCPAAQARTVVGLALRARGRVPYVEPSADDLEDPERTPAGFQRCAGEIRAAVRTFLPILAAPIG
ncbi:MAG: low molecular weight phosphatase family protein, partial [Micromonosporaceae bacterium]|nr:low molecular weight phosphatase family protein [Micromonosporaceae bacterium]